MRADGAPADHVRALEPEIGRWPNLASREGENGRPYRILPLYDLKLTVANRRMSKGLRQLYGPIDGLSQGARFVAIVDLGIGRISPVGVPELGIGRRRSVEPADNDSIEVLHVIAGISDRYVNLRPALQQQSAVENAKARMSVKPDVPRRSAERDGEASIRQEQGRIHGGKVIPGNQHAALDRARCVGKHGVGGHNRL